ncbi:hypothetical protein MKX03_003973 [Papaver bracteatum]|nr:hypothetical protein MKX03_003973 [Papaver bracteatum]
MGFRLRNHTSLPTNMSGVVVSEDDQKRVAGRSSRSIHITVMFNGDNSDIVCFRMKRDSPLSKLIDAYGEITGRYNHHTVNFLYDGIRIRPESTPHQLGIQDGDEIDVFRVQ